MKTASDQQAHLSDEDLISIHREKVAAASDLRESTLAHQAQQTIELIQKVCPELEGSPLHGKDGTVRIRQFKFWTEDTWEHGTQLLCTWVCDRCHTTGPNVAHVLSYVTLGAIAYVFAEHQRVGSCRPDARRKR